MNFAIPGTSRDSESFDVKPPPTKRFKPSKPMVTEERIERLLNAVRAQGKLGKMVIIYEINENPFLILERATAQARMHLFVIRIYNIRNGYGLYINGQLFAKGSYASLALAKRNLSAQAIDKLKNYCFIIYKKNVSNSLLPPPGSKVQKLMDDLNFLQRGFVTIDAEYMDKILFCEHVNFSDLKVPWILCDILSILLEFADTPRYLILVLNVDLMVSDHIFTALYAHQLGLQITSSDKPHRRVIVYKSLGRMDVVKELLKSNGQDPLYRLTIPKLFVYHWQQA